MYAVIHHFVYVTYMFASKVVYVLTYISIPYARRELTNAKHTNMDNKRQFIC